MIYSILAMIAVVVSANFLVQMPVPGLEEYLTWGAVIFPFAFLVNDLTNRLMGPQKARVTVAIGAVAGVILSAILADPRIALASGAAFVVGQLLNIQIFNRLRDAAWWKSPAISSTIGSVLDTYLFFGIAFYGVPFMMEHVSYAPVPLWVSLASWDLVVKLAVAAIAIVPYGIIVTKLLKGKSYGV